MWIVASAPTTFAVYMDNNAPHHSHPRQSSASPSPSALAAAAALTPAARKTRKSPSSSRKATAATPSRSMRNVTCAPSLPLCRYANKKCANPRAVKRTGGLHTFCALHRENANRNQRRLDLRKRLQRQALESSALLDRRQSLQIACARSSPLQSRQSSRSLQSLLQSQLLSPQTHATQHTLAFASTSPINITNNSDLLYEPLATPTPLRDEDVATLVTLFAPVEQQQTLDPLWFADVSMPREPMYSL